MYRHTDERMWCNIEKWVHVLEHYRFMYRLMADVYVQLYVCVHFVTSVVTPTFHQPMSVI